jgi:hypothetical protein
MMDNLHVQTDPVGKIKPGKTKPMKKIDGAVALIMALERCIRMKGLAKVRCMMSGELLYYKMERFDMIDVNIVIIGEKNV